MRLGCIIIFIGILTGASCKTSESLSANGAPVNTNPRSYIILIQLKDIDGTMSQVMSTVQQMISPMYVKVIEISTLFENLKEVQVLSSSLTEERINLFRSMLFKIQGIMGMSLSKNEKIPAE